MNCQDQEPTMKTLTDKFQMSEGSLVSSYDIAVWEGQMSLYLTG